MLCLFITGSTLLAQEEVQKFSINGAARSLTFLDNLEQDSPEIDTITAPKSLSSHAMVDLGMNIRPGKSIEIQGMVRIRNDFGGFWGSGVTFDVRQLYVKGIIGDVVRYQVGDVNYKLTPYTFYNYDQELSVSAPTVFSHLTNQVSYDNFYAEDNTWRQQGAAVDFGIGFKKYLDEIHWNLFTSRINPTNNSSVPERLFSAASMTILQSKYLSLGVNYANLYDFKGTASTEVQFTNPVTTGTANLYYATGSFLFEASGEFGQSSTNWYNDTIAPAYTDNFFDTRIDATYTPIQLGVFVRMKSVGADFRSPGAQTKRLSFQSYPNAYERITNDQILREFTMLDIMREADLYNRQLQSGLMEYDPKYDNITPYGDATPNRQGIEAGLNWSGVDQAVALGVSFSSLTEVRGQGTTDLRNYTRLAADARINVGKLAKWNRKIVIEANLRQDNTSRPGEAGVPSVDLSTSIIGAGITAQIISQLDVLAGYQQHAFSGFEFVNQTNIYGEIINFTELNVDGDQGMWGAGLRWSFSDKVYLMGQINGFSWNENLTDALLPSYTISDFALIYSMKF